MKNESPARSERTWAEQAKQLIIIPTWYIFVSERVTQGQPAQKSSLSYIIA